MTIGPETIQMGIPLPRPDLPGSGPGPAGAAGPGRGPAGAHLTPQQRFERMAWRAIPVAIWLAAWLPAVMMALDRMAAMAIPVAAEEPETLRETIVAWLGEPGLTLVAPLVSAAMGAGTWLLARALGAPRWGAAVVASVAVAAHVFGGAPAPAGHPEDAGFAAAMVLAAACTAQAVARERQSALALAFLLAAIACWLRPWAAWPAAAVLVGVVLVTRAFEERPWCGFVAAMAWGPGFWLARLFGESGGFGSALFAAPHQGGGGLQAGVSGGVAVARSLPDHLLSALTALAQALPFALLGLLAAAGVLLCVLLGGARRRAAVSAALVAGICGFGAIGYGDLAAARLLLDPLLLALAAGAAVAVPVLAVRPGRPVPARRRPDRA